ncbi:Arc family DNA-binding protein [Rosenbergiella nectarea]|uniref:Arc family DNA-binding protein n=1 Tax=Rosenbergiella nectarea TaxID=988801 RepID=UPI001BDACCF5|nr:Arc family DNA-binding protein [Rosenbergiella nectarea]MBT0729509.1 Arc family DNA-binding protein [Rosenbergiella nectarea subsp. apis]
MSERFPSQTQDKFTVRFPDGMRDVIAERAKANGRSMNSEIIHILEEAVKNETVAWDESLAPESGGENFYLSKEQLSRMVSIAAEEAVGAFVEKINSSGYKMVKKD